jgi:hypothetical protein
MPLTHEQMIDMMVQVRNSHEEWQQQAVLKEAEAAIAWATLKDCQAQLLLVYQKLQEVLAQRPA